MFRGVLNRSNGRHFHRAVSLVCKFTFLLALFNTAPAASMPEEIQHSIYELKGVEASEGLRRVLPVESLDAVTVTVASSRRSRHVSAHLSQSKRGHVLANGLRAPLLC